MILPGTLGPFLPVERVEIFWRSFESDFKKCTLHMRSHTLRFKIFHCNYVSGPEVQGTRTAGTGPAFMKLGGAEEEVTELARTRDKPPEVNTMKEMGAFSEEVTPHSQPHTQKKATLEGTTHLLWLFSVTGAPHFIWYISLVKEARKRKSTALLTTARRPWGAQEAPAQPPPRTASCPGSHEVPKVRTCSVDVQVCAHAWARAQLWRMRRAMRPLAHAPAVAGLSGGGGGVRDASAPPPVRAVARAPAGSVLPRAKLHEQSPKAVRQAPPERNSKALWRCWLEPLGGEHPFKNAAGSPGHGEGGELPPWPEEKLPTHLPGPGERHTHR